jgi:tetratricopeptide (TPR) repeat protein
MAAFDFVSAERHLARSIELDPMRARSHEWLVTLYLWTGRRGQALAHAERALELEPLSSSARAELARALLGNGRCDEALAQLEMIAELKPPLLRAAGIAAQCHAIRRQWSRAIATIRPQAEHGGRSALAQLGFMLARAGQPEEALRIRADLLERWRRGDGRAFDVALLYAGLGEHDEAINWLDRSLDDLSLVGAPGDQGALMIVGPLFDDVRDDPRFEPLRKRLGLVIPRP